jgi:hypothetical protein
METASGEHSKTAFEHRFTVGSLIPQDILTKLSSRVLGLTEFAKVIVFTIRSWVRERQTLPQKKLAIDSFGVEAHPFVFRIAKTKLNWEINRKTILIFITTGDINAIAN